MKPEEKKPEQAPQAPAEGAAKVEEKKPEGEQAKPVETLPALDKLTPDDLKALYKRSPEMFKEIVKEPEKPKEEPKPKPPEDKSAAPLSVDGVEIKLPDDVPVNREMVERYIANSKAIGLSAKQMQAQIDQQVAEARAQMAARPDPRKQQEEQDRANVATLKQRWGDKYEENMEVARRAAAKHATPAMLARLKASDPDIVEQYLVLGQKDVVEDKTPTGKGVPRKGDEEADEAQSREKALRGRYNRSPQMFGEGPK